MSRSITHFVTLMYHNVAPPAAWRGLSRSVSRYFVTPEQFCEHVRWLAEHARCLTLARVLEPDGGTAEHGGTQDAERKDAPVAVQLTCDDGWRGSFDNTAAVLQEVGWEAAVFVTTGLIGHPLFVSEEFLRTLAAAPFSVGAHSVSHLPLARLPWRRLMQELAASRSRLEDLTGRPVVAMSAPGGSVDRRVCEAAAECGYRVLYTSVPRVNVLDGGEADRTRSGRGRGRSQAEPPLRVFGRVAITGGMSCNDLQRFARGRLGQMRTAFVARRLLRGLIGERHYAALRSVLLGRVADGADMDDLLEEASRAVADTGAHIRGPAAGGERPSGAELPRESGPAARHAILGGPADRGISAGQSG